MARKEVLLDIRPVMRVGNSNAVVIDSAWLAANNVKTGDRVLIRVEALKGAKDLKKMK